MKGKDKVSVLFVCLGNICRSPTAQGIFHRLVMSEGLDERVEIDSAGTGDWHVGKPPDPRSLDAAQKRGLNIAGLRARQVSSSDFDKFDYILAMDERNLADLRAMSPPHYQGVLDLFLNFGGHPDYREVPDPYFQGGRSFELVLDLIESASEGLLAHIREHHLR